MAPKCSAEVLSSVFKINLFLERGEGRKKGRESSISCPSYAPRWGTGPATQACTLSRNRTRDLSLFGTMQTSEPTVKLSGRVCVCKLFFLNPHLRVCLLILKRGERGNNIDWLPPIQLPTTTEPMIYVP